MALDHSVSQVHLRKFYSPKLGKRMFAIRKSDLKKFTCASEDVCRIEQGNTNPYLKDSRAIERFLLQVEPRYNAALVAIQRDEIDAATILCVAGFTAYVGCCTPTAMRIHQEPLQDRLTQLAGSLDARGLIPRAPDVLGGKTLSELLASGDVRHVIDPKYPQAIGVSTVVGRTSRIGNAFWEILFNSNDDCPFVTSDNPLSLEMVPAREIPNWLVPLAPDLAVRIVPDPFFDHSRPALAFPGFSYIRREVRKDEALAINRLTVQCAEDLVFYRDEFDWVQKMVADNRYFRLEILTETIPFANGLRKQSAQRIVERK